MSRLYGSFTDASAAEKAAGALLDYGAIPDDLSLIRKEDQDSDKYQNSADTTYGQVSAPMPGEHENIQGGLSDTPSSNMMGSGMSPVTALEGNALGFSAEGAPADGQKRDIDLIDRRDTDYIYKDQPSDKELNESKLREDNSVEQGERPHAAAGISTTTAADAGSGAAKGAAAGLGIGLLAGLSSLFVPGFGLLMGSGALATALAGTAGAAASGAAAGGIYGYLKDQGVDADVAQAQQDVLTSGGAVLEVTLPSGGLEEEEARQVLHKYGAGNVYLADN